MKKQIYLLFITIISFLLLIGIAIGSSFYAKSIKVTSGVADFSSFNLDSVNNLVGEWEMYPNKLIASKLENETPIYTKLPSYNLINKTSFNYASYRMVLNNIPLNKDINISVHGEIEGFAIYLNGELFATNNLLRDDDGLINFDHLDTIYYSTQETLEVIIEVSNYTFANAGLTKAPKISSAAVYAKNFTRTLTIKALIIGALIFIALYHLIVIGIRNNEPRAFFFSLFALMGVVQVVFQRDLYTSYYNNLFFYSQTIILYINQITTYLINLLFFIIIYLFYKAKERLHPNFFELILFITPLFLIFISLIIPTSFFASIDNIFNILSIINSILLIVYASLNAKKQDYATYIIISSVGLFSCLLIDNLVNINILPFSFNTLPGFYIIFTFIYSSVTAFIRETNISGVDELVELNKKIRDTEFAFLNSQIRSHFIYNSLNSIQSLINTNPIQAAELVEDFSMYLRTRLEFNKMPQLFNIEDELENIRTYLNIEKARFGKRVNFVYDLKAGDFLIPPLTVQPLVENAVKHGISMRRVGGTVTISTYDDENYIYIKVADDGIGFDPSTLSEKQRVGTENIRSRLSLHLNATLSINSQINKGTESIIKIPKKVSGQKKGSS